MIRVAFLSRLHTLMLQNPRFGALAEKLLPVSSGMNDTQLMPFGMYQ